MGVFFKVDWVNLSCTFLGTIGDTLQHYAMIIIVVSVIGLPYKFLRDACLCGFIRMVFDACFGIKVFPFNLHVFSELVK